jgi:hypothetical protein
MSGSFIFIATNRLREGRLVESDLVVRAAVDAPFGGGDLARQG